MNTLGLFSYHIAYHIACFHFRIVTCFLCTCTMTKKILIHFVLVTVKMLQQACFLKSVGNTVGEIFDVTLMFNPTETMKNQQSRFFYSIKPSCCVAEIVCRYTLYTRLNGWGRRNDVQDKCLPIE